MEAPDDQRKLAEEIVSVNERDLEHLLTCVLEDILFAQNNAALLESGNKNEPTKIARFDRIVDKTTRDKYDQLLTGSHRPTGDTTTSTLRVTVPRDFMPTDVSNEIGGDDLQKSVHDAGVAGEPAVQTQNVYQQ